MTTTFFLVRHAVHEQVSRTLSARSPGVSLSAEGRGHAEWAAERLSRESIAALHVSPQDRAQQTARPLAQRIGVPITTTAALDELDAGEWTGRAFTELATDERWTHWNAMRSLARAPGGESALEVQTRVVSHVQRLCADHPGGGIVLVSHAEPLRSLVIFALGLGLDQWSRIEIQPAAVTTLTIGEWGCRLLRLNEGPPA